MDGVRNPFFLGLFPSPKRLIPSHHVNQDSWWIQCSYPISGSYGLTPRYAYYFLILFAMWQRRTNWLAEAAMASIMVYSGSAAIHAVVLAATRERMVPRSLLEFYGAVRVEGVSPTGEAWTWDYDQNQWVNSSPLDNSLWLPVLPMAWDSDADATLAIVGTAFLVLLPMQIWSTTLRTTRVKKIVWLWGTLLLMGMICALIAEQYVNFWYIGQLRFCPHGAHDTLPLMNDGAQILGGEWNDDEYRWNRTVQRQFIYQNSTEALSNICIYPCFESSWPLRDATEIMVDKGSYITIFDSDTFFALLLVCFALVTSTGLSSLTIAILTSLPEEWTLHGLRPHSHQDALKLKLIPQQIRWIRNIWNDHSLPWTSRTMQIVLSSYFLIIYVYTFCVSPAVVLFFIGFMEWIIWGSDPGGESFHHVGQWSTIVALGLVFTAAVISHYSKKPK
ncbi:hypothetical protein F5883DRAFT_697671 [Diaporthe sp. PMI_573]|nr:hypothetical protein F5883DRAFT_697671 [Diaporthaceae sp. PMI_573]